MQQADCFPVPKDSWWDWSWYLQTWFLCLYSCQENFHGQRNLADYSPWRCKELDTTKQLSTVQAVRTKHAIFSSAPFYFPSLPTPRMLSTKAGVSSVLFAALFSPASTYWVLNKCWIIIAIVTVVISIKCAQRWAVRPQPRVEREKGRTGGCGNSKAWNWKGRLFSLHGLEGLLLLPGETVGGLDCQKVSIRTTGNNI